MSEINKDEVNGLNRPVSPNEIQTVIKILPIKSQVRRSHCRILLDLQRRAKTNTPQIALQNYKVEKEEHFWIPFVKPHCFESKAKDQTKN